MSDKKTFSTGYSSSYRAVEVISIAAFLALQIHLIWNLSGYYVESPWSLPVSILGGLLVADFISGLVHWAGDTWGTSEWPVIGPALIRPFREHHVEPKALTHHDFVELNGSNCLVSVPVLVMAEGALWLEFTQLGVHLSVSLLTWMTLWVFFTNMFHQWAHRDDAENPALIRWLQRKRLILSPETHEVHHRAPHLEYYCITTGWLNRPLEMLGFYRKSERFVTWLTGAQPRQEA